MNIPFIRKKRQEAASFFMLGSTVFNNKCRVRPTLAAFTGGIGIAIVLLSLATVRVSGTSQFWALPTAFLGGMAAAAGIVTINWVAILAGIFSPSIVGWLNDVTGKQSAGLIFTSTVLIIGAT